MSAKTTHDAFAADVPISTPLRVLSILRACTWALVGNGNPLTWWWQHGRRNERADMEGFLYVPGAPCRLIEPGRAALASVSELKEYKPFLLSIMVRSPLGEPLRGATIEIWHATTAGVYASSSYALRGRISTDVNGIVEVLTVAPGDATSAERAGHFHMSIQDADGQCERLTTRLYLCRRNDVSAIKTSSFRWMRGRRAQNMLYAWSIFASNGGERFFDLPGLSVDSLDTLKRIEWWNAKLAKQAPGAGLKVIAGGHTEIWLNDKPRCLIST